MDTQQADITGTAPEPEPIEPPPSPPMNQPKPRSLPWPFIWIVFFFVGLMLGMVGKNYYLAQNVVIPTPAPISIPTPIPTPADETADWKTYSNAKYNFSLKYPPEFRTLSAQEAGGVIDLKPTTLLSIEKNNNSFPNPRLTIQDILLVEYIPNLATAQSCSSASGFAFNSTPLNYSKNINGQEFFYNSPYGGAAAGTHDFNVNYMTFNKRCFQIDFKHIESSDWNGPDDMKIANEEKQNSFKTLDQILSTFKFIGSTPTPSCRPRPACLDREPRCLIPETPDMCPRVINNPINK